MSVTREARQVLAELALLAGGATANLNKDSRGGGDHAGPSGDGRIGREAHQGNLFLYWAQAFASCSWEELPAMVAEAQDCLDGFRKGPGKVETKPETDKERRERILKHGAGWSVDDVVRALDVPHGEVRAAFDSKDWDHATGKPWVTADREERARRLRRAGVSVPDIARRFSVSVRTVHYWVK